MAELQEKEVTPNDVAGFYKHHPEFWFLLEVLKTGENGKAEWMRVKGYDKNKEVLRNMLLEGLTDTHSKYIFFYASLDGKCEI